MLSNIEVENSAKLLYYSDLYELTELKAKVVQFICGPANKAMKKVMESPGWEQFVKIKPELMEQLLEKVAELQL